MSAGEWKPGDVAMVTWSKTGAEKIMLRGVNDRWYESTGFFRAELARSVRPLVVLDPEDREQVARLAASYAAVASARLGDEYIVWENRSPEARDKISADLTAALREFASPTPPKPDEPGKYGVIIAGDGREWFRYTTSEMRGRDWCRPGAEGSTEYARWDDLNVVRVVEEGRLS